YAQEAEMEELYETADIISIHIPLNERNRNLVNAQYLSRFQKRIILINTARGAIVDLRALGQALESGKVYGACLDVLENEKLHRLNPEQKDAFLFLKQQENVIFTPHIAGWTFESYERINEVLAEKIRHCLDL
ncbi:MAG: NAD(P)-dependent oxidoreductase, partial [Bacteroidota bacterium]